MCLMENANITEKVLKANIFMSPLQKSLNNTEMLKKLQKALKKAF